MKKLGILLLILMITNHTFSQVIIQMKRKGGVSVIPCKVNGIDLEFIFDTGAADVTLSLNEAQNLYKRGLLLRSDIIGTKFYQTANGQIEEGITVLIKVIEIGEFKLYNVPAAVITKNNVSLLLGQSALRKLGKIEFDANKNTLKITGPKSFDFLKANILNQNVRKNYYVYKNNTLFSNDRPINERTINWISKYPVSLYKEPYSKTIVYNLNFRESFQALNSEVHIYKMPIARITKIIKDDFEDCNSDKFMVGELIYFLSFGYEGNFEVIYNNKETYVNCSFDIDKMELSERAYEGCNNIEGKILNSESEYIVWVKVKTKNGIIGWLKNPPQHDFAGFSAELFEPIYKKPITMHIIPDSKYTFKVVFFETTDKEAAILRMNLLINRGHQVIMNTKDSVSFKLAEPFKLPLSDTTRIKDSLNKYYYSGKGYVELK